ncbi:DNA-binding domain-containing protein [Trinickia fusca]|uniref:DUF2063 domain-containing protein n=1 Tax=Trinickia fusca TaxID=2419777 RepID=A0A494XJW8_9BURK|nr:DNA-binding domain-containing protein [Trinickia fusca]RKP48384.1 DUF2063 domain-containing protein [Trinickia fusca]
MTLYDRTLDAFASALLDDAIEPEGVTAATRAQLDVYRNNVRLNRVAALADAFPNVVALVGIDYFRALAQAYVMATPATSANLHEDGATLADFIRGFGPAADLPYLADVAIVDWRMHCAYYADDTQPLDPSSVVALGPERLAAASLRLMPSVGLVRSQAWPIADIVAMHEGGPVAQLDTGGQSVLVWREGFEVRWQALADSDARAFDALCAGSSIETAFASADADPNSLLTQLFRHRLIRAIEENCLENA